MAGSGAVSFQWKLLVLLLVTAAACFTSPDPFGSGYGPTVAATVGQHSEGHQLQDSMLGEPQRLEEAQTQGPVLEEPQRLEKAPGRAERDGSHAQSTGPRSARLDQGEQAEARELAGRALGESELGRVQVIGKEVKLAEQKEVVDAGQSRRALRQQEGSAGQGARAALDVANIKEIFEGLEVLPVEKREELAAPCSATWLNWTLIFMKKREEIQGEDRVVAVCAKARRLFCFLQERSDECKGHREEGAEKTRKAQLELDWGTCWPDSLPMSPRIKIRDLMERRRMFYVLAYTEEQLSKGKLHVAESARFANLSDRVLVLPRVGEGHTHAGRQYSLCTYFDLSQFPPNGVDWVSPEVFLVLMAFYIPHRLSFAFFCKEGLPTYDCTYYRPARYWIEHILGLMHAADTSHYASLADPDEPVKDANGNWNTGGLVRGVRVPWFNIADAQSGVAQLELWSHIDVVHMIKASPQILDFPNAEGVSDYLLPYAAHLHRRTKHLIKTLHRPYVAMHLRYEWLIYHMLRDKATPEKVVERLMNCTKNAIAAAKGAIEKVGATAVFIASDRDPKKRNDSEISFRSDTWGWNEDKVTAPADDALKLLLGSLPKHSMIEDLDSHLDELEKGEVVIMDKLLCSYADVFLGGTDACGGEHSFDRDVVRQRAVLKHSPQTVQRWDSFV